MTIDTTLANTVVVDTAYAAFAAGDVATILNLVADNVSWESPLTLPHGGSFSGRDGVLQFFQGIGGHWASLRLTIEGIAALNDHTVIGVVKAAGERSNGSTSNYGAAHLFTIRDGAIVSFREFVNLDAILA